MSAPTGPAPTIPDAVADPPVGKNTITHQGKKGSAS